MKRLFPILLFLTACTTLPGKFSEREIFNDNLRQALSNETQAMTAVRPPLRFANGHTVRDCRSYLAEQASGTVDEAVNNRSQAGAYLVCDALAILRHSAAEATPSSPPTSYARELMQRLDLRSFPSSLRPALGERHTPADIAQAVASMDAHTLTLDTPDWRYRFEVVADTPAANGERQWLVWFSDEARAGNYRSHSTLVIPARPDGPLVVRATRP